jgi:hypothetical protein
MVTWRELESARPDLAEGGRGLLYQFGVGLAFLATVRSDGGPRVHPMCPVLHDGGLYALLIPSPKREDLLRDRRYSMHSFPTDGNEDAFYLAGFAHLVDASERRSALIRQFLDERPTLAVTASDLDDQRAFEFDIATCLLTRTTGHGDPDPRHTIWHA